MKVKLAKNWPAVRQIAYGLGAVVLGGSSIAGWITADEAAAWTDQIEQLLGAAALLMAGLYVDRSKPAEPETVTDFQVNGTEGMLEFDPGEVSARDVIERVRAEAAGRLDDVPMPDGVRAELERRLGR